MRLQRATVRSYRLHRDLTLEFDPHLTLIAGENESGKSTLVEAIHRALFLKATVTGAIRWEMQSRLYHGHPEVELRFTVGDEVYDLYKHFAGQNGRATLSRVGGESWQGGDAEKRLADLLGVEPTGGGRGIDKRLRAQWAHLWVWQGQGGEDPAQYASAQQHRLLMQIQRVGGAVAMQSALDDLVAGHFANRYADIFTRKGKPKVGSELGIAMSAHTKAKDVLDQAETRVSRLEEAVRALEKAKSDLHQARDSLEDAKRQRRVIAEQLDQLKSLREKEQAQNRELDEVKGQLAACEEADRKIKEHQGKIQKLRESLSPLQKELERKEESLAGMQERLERARKEYEDARDRARQARMVRDRALARERVLDAGKQYRELQRQVEKIESHEEEIQQLRDQLVRLPDIDRKDLDTLEGFDRDRAKAVAALEATAPEIELLESSHPVRIGGRAMSLGERTVVTETEELIAGDLRLRIHPGGGKDLVSLRHRVISLDGKIREALDRWGLVSLERATEVVAQRQEIEQRIARKQSALEVLNPQRTREQFDEAKQRLGAAEAELRRRQQSLDDAAPDPGDLDAARKEVQQAQQLVDHEEAQEEEAASRLRALGEQLDGLTEEREHIAESIRDLQREQNEIGATIRVLVEQEGDEVERSRKLRELLDAKRKLEENLVETSDTIAGLQPDLLEADRERIERVIERAQETIRNAEQERAAARALLQTDGVEDPRAELARARAEFMWASGRLQAARRHADAIALVHELFDTQQRKLAEHFSRPLAEKINTYLQPVFGRKVRADAVFEGNEFVGVQLVNPNIHGALSFDALSGGTREQISAAVRLAIAELLAEDHDGTLPVVFDDAFANSDPLRIKRLQRTLDLGARRGLQIIVLTCHSESYSLLGARKVSLEPPLRAGL